MTPQKAVGMLSVFAGVASIVGIADGISIIGTAPIGIVSGAAKRILKI